MSTVSTDISKKPKVRLKFIDMARTVAILLMLEGHFVDDSLMMEVRDPGNSAYTAWQFMRSFTAPMFLTVTGLIFVYLLLKQREVSWYENIRIKKGFKRVLELFFWGYMVQWYAFHVLECIAVGIFTILIIYGLYKLIKVIPLWIYFFVAGVTIFSLYPVIQQMPHKMAWPESMWHSVIDALHYDRVVKIQFPTVPFIGYTMFGGMIGALLHDFPGQVKKLYFPAIFSFVGAALFFFSPEIFGSIDSMVESVFTDYDSRFAGLNWLYERIGMVIMELSILMYIDNLWGDKIKGDSLFLKIGQNTLTIYILHMVLLYGSISGLGLKKEFHHALGPWEVAFGAAGFILFFVILIKYLDQVKAAASKVLDWMLKIITLLVERIKKRLV